MKCESCGNENVEGARFCAKCGAPVPVTIVGQNDPLIGQVIGGRFHITGVLGEGGMGIVYVGEQQMGTTIRKVAVKTLHAHLSKDASVMARFHREVGTVAQLEHPNTIKVYDFGSTKDGTLYIAMEFVSGQSLADVILKQGALPAERVIHIMRQICGALDEAHLQGIVHRDLKPENIILTQRAGETDFAKVLDFGIAARTESADAQKEAKLTQQGMVLGTPPYMSPEQFTGKQLDARSDVYSLGVMAYEMLTGQLPFDAETPWEWATQHMTANPKPFEVVAAGLPIPEPIKSAVLKSLHKERTQRQDSARQFFAELSGGARITVEAGALGVPDIGQAGGYQPTAAMPAVPGQVAPAASPYGATALTPQVAPMGGPAMNAPNPVGAVVAPAVPLAPVKKPAAGGKGLLIGLGGLGAVLAIAIVIVLVRSNPSDEVTPLTAPTSTPAATAAVVTGETPNIEAPTTPTGPEAAVEPSKPIAVAGGKPAGGAGKTQPGAKTGSGGASATGAAPAGGGQPAVAQATTPAPTGAGPTAPGASNAACDECLSRARSGAIPAAAAAWGRCTDAAKKAECSNIAKVRAPMEARTQAMNVQCGPARSTVEAATRMGAGSTRLATALQNTSCAR